MKKILCGVLCAALAVGLAFSVAPHTAVRTAYAASMKEDGSAAVAQRIAEEFGMTVAREVRKGGAHIRLAPGANIHRDPLCGRNFECFSKDPLVSGLFGSAVTTGAQSLGTAVCLKHFAASNQEFNRHASDSCVSARA